jgi:hypothetical protein
MSIKLIGSPVLLMFNMNLKKVDQQFYRIELRLLICYVSQTKSETNANNIIIRMLCNGKGRYSVP